jgi:hypothetical protein
MTGSIGRIGLPEKEKKNGTRTPFMATRNSNPDYHSDLAARRLALKHRFAENRHPLFGAMLWLRLAPPSANGGGVLCA